MQAVILAAGKSTRTYPITLTRPKCLVKIANRPIIQHNLESLRGLADEAIIVVGYMKDMVKGFLGSEFQGIRITYVEQEEQLGTGHALLAAEPAIKGRFMVMMGDDIYYRQSMEKVLAHENSLLVQKVKEPSRFGVWVTGKDGFVTGFAEKPAQFVSDLANCGLYVLEPEIFQEIKKLEKSERGEYELNEAVNAYAKARPVRCEDAGKGWLSVGYPWDILGANERLLEEMKNPRMEGTVEPHVVIKGKVCVGKGSVIMSGTYIEGPCAIGENCIIGPNAYIRPATSIGDNCRIRAEVVDSVIMDGTTAKHHSYIGHSVIGEDVNIACGTVTADYRHDGKEHTAMIKGSKVDSMRRKLGAFIGDSVRTGINTSIYPGRMIWPGRTTLPGEVVSKDKA
jgi:UDP-N-acetylglucosamine diphosphorylase/glucosamine-1-phosphate N-acetyltransferase